MKQEHEIVAMVYEAKGDNAAASRLVEQYLPFIKSETAKYIRRMPQEGWDDELSIAMFAFHEAVLSYEKMRGSFLAYAARAIRNRLIDYSRKEQRHSGLISLNKMDDDSAEDGRTLIEKLDTGKDDIREHVERSAAKEEIRKFATELSDFGLSLADIADNCPKQERTLKACHQALVYAKKHPILLDMLVETGKLPLRQLASGAGVEKKTLERHRKYMVAILLAYTNGFEIIRGHLKRIVPGKGGQQV